MTLRLSVRKSSAGMLAPVSAGASLVAGKVFGRTLSATVGTSAAVDSTTVPYVPPTFDANTDWQDRVLAPGMVSTTKYNDPESLGTYWPGIGVPALRGYAHGTDGAGLRDTRPEFSTAQKPSGNGSLHFKMWGNPPAGYTGTIYADIAGMAWINAFPDGRYGWGENSEFFVQARFWWSPEMLNQYFGVVSGSGGIKFFDIVPCDTPQISNWYWTSEGLAVVMQLYEHSKVPILYGFDRFANRPPFFPETGGVWPYYYLQNGPSQTYDGQVVGGGVCNFVAQSDAQTAAGHNPYDIAGCVQMTHSQWVTVMLGVSLGARQLTEDGEAYIHVDTRIRQWMQLEGLPPILLLDFNKDLPGYRELTCNEVLPDGSAYKTTPQIPKFCKFFGFPYMTERGIGTPHADGDIYMDEVCMSHDPIPFPGGYHISNGNTALQAALAPGNTAVDLGAWTTGFDDTGDAERWNEFSGMRICLKRRRIYFRGGGHVSTNWNGLGYYDIDAGVYGDEYPSTPLADMVPTNWDNDKDCWLHSADGGPDNRPVTRHWGQGYVIRGHEIIDLCHVEGNQIGLPAAWDTEPGQAAEKVASKIPGPFIGRYNFLTKTYSHSATTRKHGTFGAWLLDPISNKVLGWDADQGAGAQGGLWFYDPVLDTIECFLDGLNDLSRFFLDDLVTNDTSLHQTAVDTMTFFPPTGYFYVINPHGVMEVRLNRDNPALSVVRRMHLFAGPSAFGWFGGWCYDSYNRRLVSQIRAGIAYSFDPLGNGGKGQFYGHTIANTSGVENLPNNEMLGADYDPVHRCVFSYDAPHGRMQGFRLVI